jgi:hypothetical protein
MAIGVLQRLSHPRHAGLDPASRFFAPSKEAGPRRKAGVTKWI